MKIISVFASFLFLTSCGGSARGNLAVAEMGKIIKEVDDIKIPIDENILTEQFPESVEGNFVVKFKGGADQIDVLKQGYRASLVGDRKKPIAIIFFVHSTHEFYLVPFKNVSSMERPRRLTKMADRFYLIESNRSSKGQFGKELK